LSFQSDPESDTDHQKMDDPRCKMRKLGQTNNHGKTLVHNGVLAGDLKPS